MQSPNPRKRLVLFDVDETLVAPAPKSGRINYVLSLMEEYFGVPRHGSKVDGLGRTYRWTLRARLEEAGFRDVEKDPRFEEALADGRNVIGRCLERVRIAKVPGSEELVKALLERRCTLGILTGNTQKAAGAKLRAAGMDRYFSFGAYGDAAFERAELVPLAMRKAHEIAGTAFSGGEVFVIGDSAQDIRCAKANGVLSIAVATGPEAPSMLKAMHPDFFFRDFSDTDAILKAIG